MRRTKGKSGRVSEAELATRGPRNWAAALTLASITAGVVVASVTGVAFGRDDPDRTRRNLNRPPQQQQPQQPPRQQPSQSPSAEPQPSPPPPPPPPPPAPRAEPAPTPSSGGGGSPSGDRTRRSLVRPGASEPNRARPGYVEIAPPATRPPQPRADQTQRNLVKPIPAWQRRGRDDHRSWRSHDDWWSSQHWRHNTYWYGGYTGWRSWDDDVYWYGPTSYQPFDVVIVPRYDAAQVSSWTGVSLGTSWSGGGAWASPPGWRYSQTWWTGSPLEHWRWDDRSRADWTCGGLNDWWSSPWRASQQAESGPAYPGRIVVVNPNTPAVVDDVARYRYDDASGTWVQIQAAPESVDIQRERAAAARRVELARGYDVVPDVDQAVHATLRGEYEEAVTIMRRAASQNADALVSRGEGGRRVASVMDQDSVLRQRAIYALNAFDQPPRGADRSGRGLSEQDARFMRAALRAVLDTAPGLEARGFRETALDVLEQSRREGDTNISTRNLIDALVASSAPSR